MAHQELRETTDLTVQDAGIHHSNMVRNVAVWMQEVLQKEKSLTKNPPVISEPNEHVANAVQNTNQKLVTQLQQMQTIMQAMHLQYTTAPQPTHQAYGGCGYYIGQNKHCDWGGCGSQHWVSWRGVCAGQGSSDLTHYCWTQIMCVHSGNYCMNPS